MNNKYICYCGLYCENCAVKVKITPSAKNLHEEMVKAGFEDIIQYIPDGDKFWSFLKGMVDPGICTSCKEGGGNPGCAVRICAKEKDVEVCALCEQYPCEKFPAFFDGYPVLKQDNLLLREKGLEAWAKLQDERRERGFTYGEAS
ncbi:MAG: DUF3795 domain-containing protein [Treponema sp.]|nr:DUF3795 domain-containing protein [Treponema sp.]